MKRRGINLNRQLGHVSNVRHYRNVFKLSDTIYRLTQPTIPNALHFYSLEVVSCFRDTQLQVSKITQI